MRCLFCAIKGIKLLACWGDFFIDRGITSFWMITIHVTFIPPPITEGCLFCPKGTYWELGSCNYCPIGTYNEFTAMLECFDCPLNKVTETYGATKRQMCIDPPAVVNIHKSKASPYQPIFIIGGAVLLVGFLILILVCIGSLGYIQI